MGNVEATRLIFANLLWPFKVHQKQSKVQLLPKTSANLSLPHASLFFSHRHFATKNLIALHLHRMMSLLHHSFDISQRFLPGIDARMCDILERNRRHKVSRLPSLIHFTVELINLLERKPFGLVDECPNEEDADETTAAPDEEDFGAQVCIAGAGVYEIGCHVCECLIEFVSKDGR